jgi:2-methylcitrate dehydratase
MSQTQGVSRRSQPSLVERLAEWVLAVPASEVPERAITQAKLLLLDTLGCGLAALDHAIAAGVVRAMLAQGGEMQATVIGSGRKISAQNAVLANGALVRVLDLNDYTIESGGLGGHPSDNIPVALAVGETGGRSGRDILAAVVLGYEIFARLRAMMDSRSDWDGVSVSGFVATAVAGRLLGIDRNRLAHALALSGARTATSAAVRSGDMSAAKSIANALVAQQGVQAALLAAEGATGPLAIFEQKRGLKSIFPYIESASAIDAPLVDGGYIMRASIKAYPCVATGQAAVTAALDMNRRLGGDTAKAERIEILMADLPQVRNQQADRERADPQSHEAADHSFPFIVAVAMIDGIFGQAQYAHERWHDPQVRALMGRIEMQTDASWNSRAPNSFPCAIRVTGSDGSKYLSEIGYPPGYSRDGIDAQVVIDKFHAGLDCIVTPGDRDRIVAAAMDFDHSANCAALTAALAVSPQS